MDCPICKSNNYSLKSWGKSKIAYCPYCELFFSVEYNDSTQYYQSNYHIDSTETFLDNLRRYSLLPQHYKLAELMKKFLSKNPTILDFGCGKGFFIDEVRRDGFSVFGIEISKYAQEYAQSIGLDVRSSICDFSIKFDAITFWHSFEHLSNPKEVLEQAYTYLNNEGYLFIRVPNFASFWSKFLKDKWIWFQPQNHITHFSLKQLTKLIETLNFKVIIAKNQRPNDLHTFAFFLSSLYLLRKRLPIKLLIRKIFAKIVEWLTGSEILIVAKK